MDFVDKWDVSHLLQGVNGAGRDINPNNVCREPRYINRTTREACAAAYAMAHGYQFSGIDKSFAEARFAELMELAEAEIRSSEMLCHILVTEYDGDMEIMAKELATSYLNDDTKANITKEELDESEIKAKVQTVENFCQLLHGSMGGCCVFWRPEWGAVPVRIALSKPFRAKRPGRGNKRKVEEEEKEAAV